MNNKRPEDYNLQHNIPYFYPSIPNDLQSSIVSSRNNLLMATTQSMVAQLAHNIDYYNSLIREIVDILINGCAAKDKMVEDIKKILLKKHTIPAIPDNTGQYYQNLMVTAPHGQFDITYGARLIDENTKILDGKKKILTDIATTLKSCDNYSDCIDAIQTILI